MSTTLVLGAGVMGTAFTFPLADSGGRVLLVGTHLDDELIDSVKSTRVHPKLGVQVADGVEPFSHVDLADAFSHNPSLIVLGVSSPGVGYAMEQLATHLREPVPILMLTKGLAVKDGAVVALPAILAKSLARDRTAAMAQVGGVGGPCIAGELAVRRETRVVFGAEGALQKVCKERLRAPYYHVHYTDDVAGVEASAALKNFLALGVGAGAGMLDIAEPTQNNALMINPESALFAQAATELVYLVTAMGGRSETAAGLAGIGDLYGTCRAGRNSRMGRLLGGGLAFREAKETMAGDTIEGADLALTIGPTLREMTAHGRLDAARLPLAEAILRVVCDGEVFSFDFSAI